jgi:hypothetical protein
VDAAADAKLSIDVEDVQLQLFLPHRLPAPVVFFLRLLRPLGRIFETSDGDLASLERPLGMDERSINPTPESLKPLRTDTRDVPAGATLYALRLPRSRFIPALFDVCGFFTLLSEPEREGP